MTVLLWSVIGGVVGAAVGFVAALALASALPAPNDGTFAMGQMVVCLPIGAPVGLVAGAVWGMRG